MNPPGAATASSPEAPAGDPADERPFAVRVREEAETEGPSEVHDILSVPPCWIVRGGLGTVFLALALLLALGAFIPYPETVSGRVVISQLQPPVGVVAPRSGRLVQWRARTGQTVTHRTVLAVLESGADAEAVLALEAQLEGIRGPRVTATTTAPPALEPQASLGELQPAWSAFITAAQQHHALLAETHFAEKEALLTNQIVAFDSLADRLATQVHLLERERDLVRRDHERQQVLFREGLVNATQLAESEAALLAKERACAQAESSRLQSRVTSIESEKALADLRLQRREQERTARLAVEAAFQRLRGEIAVWEAQHVLRAPVDGTVVCFKFWSAQQHVAAGEEVLTIAPPESKLIGRMLLKQAGAGKVRPGQTVRIKLDDFPAFEFGSVQAQVEGVSSLPREGAYLVTLRLAAGLDTTHGLHLEHRPERHGEASIVTRRASFLDRLLRQIAGRWTSLSRGSGGS